MLAILCALLSFFESSIFPVSVLFLSLALLFLVLSKFPKKRPYLWGRNHGVKKSIFVCCAIIISIGFFTLWETTLGLTPSSTGQSNTGIIGSPETNETSPQASTEPPAITLTDVQSWYEAQLPGLGQSLMTSLPSVSGLSNVNITDSKFRFGEDSGWYDCHYTFYFDCQVSGASCSGEARAFLKYSDNAPAWFHIEIVRDSDWATIVEHYDESYDQIIESYYKELVAQYGG